MIGECRSHTDRGGGIGDLRRRHLQTPLRDMQRITDSQSHLAIDTGTRVPARTMLPRVGFDHNHVRLAKFYKRRGVDTERHITIVPAARQLTVHIDFWKCHHTIKVEIDLAPLVLALQFNRLAVPTDTTPRQLAGITAFGRIERAGDGPIVGHCHRFPRSSIIVGLRHTLRLLAASKSPTVVQSRFNPGSLQVHGKQTE